MATIVSVSDFHIHDDSKLVMIRKFVQEMNDLKPDILVYLGDVGDPWEETWDVIKGTQSWKELGELNRSRWGKGLPNIWVNRNHDYSARRRYLPGARMKSEYRADGFFFKHGWEFDWIWNGFDFIWNLPLFPGISSVAYWLSSRFPRLSIWIWSRLRALPWFKKETPYQTKARGAGDEWTRHVGLLHFRAMDYAKRTKVKLVIGHTHYPMIYGELLADDGDMTDSFSYLYIQNGKWQLRTI
jgi:hypothetical protein